MAKKKKTLKDILKPTTDSIKQDHYDKFIYKELISTQKNMLLGEQKLKEFYPPIEELNRDVYASLYKVRPEFNDPNLIKNTHKLNFSIMESLSKAKKYEELHESTKYDPALSMLGTSSLQEDVKKILEEKKDEVEKIQKAINDAQKAINQAGQGNGKGNPADEDADKISGSGKSKKKISLEEAKKKLDEALKEVDKFTKENFKRSKVNSMVSDANEQVSEVSEMISNWGLDQSKEYRYTGHEEKLALLDEIKKSRKLKEISKFLGRLKLLKFKEGRDKVKKGYEEVSEITMSNKIDKMLVSEYNNLNEPMSKLIFLQRFINKKLLTYRLKGKTKKETGAVVVCIDSSGSMSGDSEIWAKGVAMGVLESARAQKRDMFIIHFSDTRDPKDLKVNNLEKENQHNIKEIIDFVNYFENGGTLFHPALDKARELIGTNDKFSKADILFITDGQSAVSNKWLADFLDWKYNAKVNLVSIIIDTGWASDSSLNEFSDKVHKLSNIMSNDGLSSALDIISSI